MIFQENLMTNFKFHCLTPYLWSTKIHEEPLVPLLGDMMNPSLAHPAVLSWCIPRLWPTFNIVNIVLAAMINNIGDDDQQRLSAMLVTMINKDYQ